jgi:hypothetical protein
MVTSHRKDEKFPSLLNKDYLTWNFVSGMSEAISWNDDFKKFKFQSYCFTSNIFLIIIKLLLLFEII